MERCVPLAVNIAESILHFVFCKATSFCWAVILQRTNPFRLDILPVHSWSSFMLQVHDFVFYIISFELVEASNLTSSPCMMLLFSVLKNYYQSCYTGKHEGWLLQALEQTSVSTSQTAEAVLVLKLPYCVLGSWMHTQLLLNISFQYAGKWCRQTVSAGRRNSYLCVKSVPVPQQGFWILVSAECLCGR